MIEAVGWVVEDPELGRRVDPSIRTNVASATDLSGSLKRRAAK